MMRILEFVHERWHDQQTYHNADVLRHDSVYRIYQKSAIVLDRILGQEFRQDIGPLIFGMELLQFIACLSVREESSGIFSLFISDKGVPVEELREIIKSRIAVFMREKQFIQRFNSVSQKVIQ